MTEWWRIWVAELYVSDATAAKVTSQHGLEVAEIRDAVLCRAGLRATWDDHASRGLRAMVKVEIRGLVVLLVLYPVADHPMGDVYHLGSAYPIEGM